MVATAKQTLKLFVPDRESKFAQQKVCALSAPLCVGGKYQFIVGGRLGLPVYGAKPIDQILPVVELSIAIYGEVWIVE
jgi:hypothetical protein